MTEQEAKEAIVFHAGRGQDSRNWEDGFLASLRPYSGKLNVDSMKEIEACLVVLAPKLQNGDSIDREILASFLYIIGAGQQWALHPEGMLRRNGLISESDLITLQSWLAEFSIALAMLIEGMDIETALGMLDVLKKD